MFKLKNLECLNGFGWCRVIDSEFNLVSPLTQSFINPFLENLGGLVNLIRTCHIEKEGGKVQHLVWGFSTHK